LRRLLIAVVVCAVMGAACVFGGPVSSGAMLLLRPGGHPTTHHGVDESYQPLHKGGIDLATGLYVREDEDLVVPGEPGLTLRRAYLSNYRVSKQFGIGATHNGEIYLVGDGVTFQSAALILATGTQIRFNRVSPGRSFWNAVYEHTESPSPWRHARLGWVGIGWALRSADGSLAFFKGCTGADVCSILKDRDADGHVTVYRRDSQGRLVRMEAGSAWIAFDYDGTNRVTRAYDNRGRQVVYEYDVNGRLSRVVGDDGAIRRYTYTPKDQMATIVEPGTDIENQYDADGRCTRQINRFPDDDPYVFDFSYDVERGKVVRVRTQRSDGTWSTVAFNGSYSIAETWGSDGQQPAEFTYERDATTKAVTALTVTCPDRTGRPLRHSSVVRDGNEEQVKWDILQTHCSWRRARSSDPDATPLLPR
jgi:YD repeat-containing protein